MNNKALHKITYGLYIVASKKGDKYNAQVANTLFQISNSPPTIAVSINKQNLTHEYIKESRAFAASVLSQDAPLSLVGHFGFKSGREVDKLAGQDYQLTPAGLPYITSHTLAWMEAKVVAEADAGTHTIFIGELTGAEVLMEGLPMTYAYYQQVKRGTVPQSAPSYTPREEKKVKMDKYVCNICGYVYDPEQGDPENGVKPGTPFENLPGDWKCPVCGAGKEDFTKES